MNRVSELDPYWIAERYHGSHNMEEFVNCLHEYKVPRDDGVLIWHIIDAAVDIAPQNAMERRETGEEMCRFNSSAVHHSEYRETSEQVESAPSAIHNTCSLELPTFSSVFNGALIVPERKDVCAIFYRELCRQLKAGV